MAPTGRGSGGRSGRRGSGGSVGPTAPAATTFSDLPDHLAARVASAPGLDARNAAAMAGASRGTRRAARPVLDAYIAGVRDVHSSHWGEGVGALGVYPFIMTPPQGGQPVLLYATTRPDPGAGGVYWWLDPRPGSRRRVFAAREPPQPPLMEFVPFSHHLLQHGRDALAELISRQRGGPASRERERAGASSMLRELDAQIRAERAEERMRRGHVQAIWRGTPAPAPQREPGWIGQD